EGFADCLDLGPPIRRAVSDSAAISKWALARSWSPTFRLLSLRPFRATPEPEATPVCATVASKDYLPGKSNGAANPPSDRLIDKFAAVAVTCRVSSRE